MPIEIETRQNLPVGLTTDYLGTGKPIEKFAPMMADAGFKRALWCEKSSAGTGDYLYSSSEVESINKLFERLGIDIYQVHAPEGAYNGQYVSPDLIERQKGIEIVRNRILMARDLGAKVVTLHAPHLEMEWPEGPRACDDALYSALSELQKDAMDAGVRIGLENIEEPFGQESFDNFPVIVGAVNRFGPEFIGITGDTGHFNLVPGQAAELDKYKNRLIETHLNDNGGVGASASGRYKLSPDRPKHDDDMHRMMFSGTFDFERFARIIATSGVNVPLTSEASKKYDSDTDTMLWLKLEKENLEAFSRMVDSLKSGSQIDPGIIASHRVRILRGVLQNPVGEIF